MFDTGKSLYAVVLIHINKPRHQAAYTGSTFEMIINITFTRQGYFLRDNLILTRGQAPMTALIEQLERDHQQMLRMMYIFKRDLTRLTSKPALSSALDPLIDILDYIKIYPENWHHPAEDILFNQLRQKPQVSLQAIDLVLGDHPRLEALTTQLGLIFRELQQAQMLPSGPVLRLAHRFCSEQIAHIHAERNIFNAITQRFTPDEWQQVNDAITERFQLAADPGSNASTQPSARQTPPATANFRVH